MIFNNFSSYLTYNCLVKRAKLLRIGFSNTGGRNDVGKIVSYKISSKASRKILRFVDFWRRLASDFFIIKFLKDPNRTATVSLVFYQTGVLSFLILPDGYQIGDKVSHSVSKNLNVLDNNVKNNFNLGSVVQLKQLAAGDVVFNVELWPFKGAQLCRAAGTSAVLLSLQKKFAVLKLKSGWRVVLSDNCYATTGTAPNSLHMYKNLKKAGYNINIGRRQTTRGVAMNAVDHPHGGGRGKTSGGPQQLTPWGKVTKCRKTVTGKRRVAKLKIRYR